MCLCMFFREVNIIQLCPTLCDPMDYTIQSMEFSSQNTGVGSCSLLQGIFPTRDQNQVSHTAGRFLTSWATREACFCEVTVQMFCLCFKKLWYFFILKCKNSVYTLTIRSLQINVLKIFSDIVICKFS